MSNGESVRNLKQVSAFWDVLTTGSCCRRYRSHHLGVHGGRELLHDHILEHTILPLQFVTFFDREKRYFGTLEAP